MKTLNKTTVTKDRKAMLSILWIFVLFNLTYADILTLYFNNVLQKEAWKAFQSGTVGSFHITQGFVLVGGVLLETAIAMVLLSLILKYRANRWANIIAALLQTAAVAQSLTGPLYQNLYYAFFATIEIACMLFIVWYAWTWRQPEEGGTLTSGQSSLQAKQYAAVWFVSLILPQYSATAAAYSSVPILIAELSTGLWLLIAGIEVQPSNENDSRKERRQV